MPIIKKIIYIPRNILVFFIRLYQIFLSPDHSFWAKKAYPHGFCKYYPTCSEYGRQVIKKNGAIVGGLRSAWRILRCNPWSKGGIDEP